METGSVFPQSGEKLGSYWSRPGGKFGTIAGLVIFGIVGYYLFPIASTIVWNTINLGIALAVAAVAWIVLSNRKLWMSIRYFYEFLMKKLVGIIIELDPFIIAEDYVKDIEKERDTLYNKTLEVEGEKEKLEMKIAEKQKDKQKQLNMAAAAQQKGMAMELTNATRQVARLDQYISQLTPIKENLNNIGTYLTAVHKNSKYMLEDMKNDLELKKDLYYSVTHGNNALKSALKVFSGDPEKKMMVEQSMNYLKDDIGLKLASMKKAISYSADFMKSIDLENASYQAEGLKMLEEYKPELFAYDTNHEIVNLPKGVEKTAANPSYDNLLK